MVLWLLTTSCRLVPSFVELRRGSWKTLKQVRNEAVVLLHEGIIVFLLVPVMTYRIRLTLLFLMIVLTAVSVQAQGLAVVQGRVVDESGIGLSFVNVFLAGTTDGAATDRIGHFQFASRHLRRQQLTATMIGFEPATRFIDLAADDTITVHIVLWEALIELVEAIVTASTYVTGEDETVTLQSLEVITTPGAAADIFLAVKTFPGVAMVDEGAGLFVRGGDVSETVILLDQATVTHPYKFESPTGGVFGTIPPFLVSGTVFSSGGFSARYGNALSGVLAMDSQNMPEQQTYAVNLGLAAASLGADIPIIPEKFGLRFTGNRSFTDMMFRLNGQHDNFTVTPRGSDVNLSLIYSYSSTGRVKIFNFMTEDRLGVVVDEPSFVDVYWGRTNSSLHNVQWTDVFGHWFVRTSASLSRYKARRHLGNLDLEPGDDTYKLRTDVEHDIDTYARLLFGGEYERTNNSFHGTIPFQDDVLNPEADVFSLAENYDGTRAGAYVEVEVKPMRRVVADIGIRTDYHTLAGGISVDPRVSVRYVLSKHTDLRLAWGRYHQFASPYEFNATSGNPSLEVQGARHLIVGISHERDMLMVRIEAYAKNYDNLVLRHPVLNFTNDGEGHACGLDVFFKYGAFLRTRFNGWVAYSFLQSCRVQPRDLGSDVVYESGPSPFDITHNLSIVAKMRLIGFLSGGLTFRHATGRPVTPVVGALPAGSGNYYLPIDGPVGSERLPAFRRLDAQISYYLPFKNGHNATFYLAVSNVFNRANVLDSDYSVDYEKRTERKTNFRRFVYFGIAVNFNR